MNLALLLQEQAAGDTSSESIDWVQSGKDLAMTWGPPLLMAIGVLIVGSWIAAWMVRLVMKLLEKRNIDPTLSRFLGGIVGMLLKVLVVLTALETLGVPTTNFAAIVAAAGFAIGFALKDSLGSFAAGVMIILFRPFRAGDFVEAGGTSGVVREVGVFATTMTTPDNKKVIVPNSAITSGTIVNYSAEETRRVDLVFGIGYGDDIAKAKQVLEKVLAGEDRILKEPAPTIAVSELADSSVNFVCRPWVKTADYWAVYWALTEKVKLEFDANDISIPFPQRDVHMHQVVA